MADEDLRRQHPLYGSAGMARAGMIPTTRRVPEPEPEPEPASEEPEELPEDQGKESSEAPSEKKGEAQDTPEAAAPEPVTSEPEAPAEPAVPEYRGICAAVIGHTGSGGFGRGLDTVFQRLDGVRLEALADGNASTVEKSRLHSGAPSGYQSYEEMLQEERVDLASVSVGTLPKRFEVIRNTLVAGAHILCESPLAYTLKEGEELLSLASENQLKIAVAHRLRLHPHVARFHREQAKWVGDIVEMRVFGDMSRYPGGRDLLSNGPDLFDLVRWFGGEVSYCTATITSEDIPAIGEDAKKSKSLGYWLGDSIRAEFVLESGVPVSYVSGAAFKPIVGPPGIEFIGTRGRMRLYSGDEPVLSYQKFSDPKLPTRKDTWKLWPRSKSEYQPEVDRLTGIAATTRLFVKDLLAAIENDQQPECSAENALKSLEMVHGVWQAGITMKRAYFPLVNRLHPLGEESR